jgi:hypothetical protein
MRKKLKRIKKIINLHILLQKMFKMTINELWQDFQQRTNSYYVELFDDFGYGFEKVNEQRYFLQKLNCLSLEQICDGLYEILKDCIKNYKGCDFPPQFCCITFNKNNICFEFQFKNVRQFNAGLKFQLRICNIDQSIFQIDNVENIVRTYFEELFDLQNATKIENIISTAVHKRFPNPNPNLTMQNQHTKPQIEVIGKNDIAEKYAEKIGKQLISVEYEKNVELYGFVELTNIEQLCNSIKEILQNKLLFSSKTKLQLLNILCISQNVIIFFVNIDKNTFEYKHYDIYIRNIDQSILQTNGKKKEFEMLLQKEL